MPIVHSRGGSAIPWPFALFVASCSSTCAYEGSQELPVGTDIHRFDPVAAYPAVLAAAGGGSVLQSIDASFVREDGTQDLAATYIPVHLKEVTTYKFVGPTTKPRDPKVPVGAAGTEPFEMVRIDIGEPRWITVSKNGQKGGSSYKKLGMTSRRDGVPSKGAGLPAPACSFAKLWTGAKTKGAATGAVAQIDYGADGYRFRIDGTPVDLHFDVACKLMP